MERTDMFERYFYNFYSLLQKMVDEAKTYDTQEKDELVRIYETVREWIHIAYKEGLLALDEKREKLESIDEENSLAEFTTILLTLLIDCADPEDLCEIAMGFVISDDFCGMEGIESLMILRGILSVQSGENPYIAEMKVKSLLPHKIRREVERKEKRQAEEQAKERLAIGMERIKKLCMDDDPEEGIDSIAGGIEAGIRNLSDEQVQRLLRNIDNRVLAVAMKGWRGSTRKRIFENMSRRLAVALCEDMTYMEPVRRRDADEATEKIGRIMSGLYPDAVILEKI